MREPIPVDSLPEMTTVSEAGAVLRVSDTAVRGMVLRGELEAERVGRLIRIRRSSLERLVRGTRDRPALRAVK
jgi:excisionase family DNA binding protein